MPIVILHKEHECLLTEGKKVCVYDSIKEAEKDLKEIYKGHERYEIVEVSQEIIDKYFDEDIFENASN